MGQFAIQPRRSAINFDIFFVVNKVSITLTLI